MDNTPSTPSTHDSRQLAEPGKTPKLTPAEAEALIPPPARAKRGFAVLSPEKKREIASMGGKAAHEHGRAHRFTSEEARAAGKKRHQLRMMALSAAKAADVGGVAPGSGAAAGAAVAAPVPGNGKPPAGSIG